MPRRFDDGPEFSTAFPRPSKALTAVLVGLLALWVMFAVSVNWRDSSLELFSLLCGNVERILQGQVWRLFTAPLMHDPRDVGHILVALLGLYFLTPSLEQGWGSARLVRFIFFSSLIAYVIQVVGALVLPTSITARIIPDYWFGALPAVDAIAVAWALSFKDQTVRLMFVLPVTGRSLLLFVGVMNVLYVIVAKSPPSGLIAPFGGMFSGWLLGGSTPSPLRRAYLKLRLAQLSDKERKAQAERARRAKSSGLRVIRGGQDPGDDDDDNGKSGGGGSDPGRWLN